MLYLQHNRSDQRKFSTELNAAESLPDEYHIQPTPTVPPPRPVYRPPQPATKAETEFRHGFWKVKRRKVLDVMRGMNESPRAIDAMECCGSECVVEYSVEAKKHRLRANYCHNRHCEPCMRAKGNKLAGNLRRRLEKEPEGRYRFITLTLKHSNSPLREQIKRLYASFKKLRAKKFWKDTQRGGAACLEVKYKEKTGRWHPHLHVISEGDFVDKHDLSRGWHSATGDSQIVDIRALKSCKDAAHYIAKYVAKGTNGDVWNYESAAQEWVSALKGIRFCMTYGQWRGYKLTATVEKFTDWKAVWTLTSLHAAVAAGHEHALRLLLDLEGWKMGDDADQPRVKAESS
jgi:hypothetical protein